MRLPLRFMNWPLRAKMVALLIVASLLPLGTATWIHIKHARADMLTSASALLGARGDQLVQQLDTFHSVYLRSCYRIAHLPDIISLCQAKPNQTEGRREAIKRLLGVWTSSDSRLRGISILDASGTVLVSTEQPLVGLNLAYRKYVKQAMEGSQAISDIHLAEAEIGSVPTISYLSPIRGPGGEVIGVSNVSVFASAFWDLMKASNQLAGPGSYAVLYDSHGIRIAHTYRDESVFHPAGALDPNLVNEIVAENRFGSRTRALLEEPNLFPEQFERAQAASPSAELFRGYSHTAGRWTYNVTRRFQTVPWTVFYAVPEASLEAPIAEMTRDSSLFAAVIIVLALGGGALFAAVILKPIRFLAQATDAIAAGELAARVPAGNTDELGRLGRSFNAMADRIEAQSADLEKSRDELEIRVQERTAALTLATRNLQTEITERRQAEASLRKSEAQLQTIVENLDEGVIVSDLNGRLLHFNRAALRLHGYATVAESQRMLPDLADTFELSSMDGVIWPVDQWPLARALRGEKIHDLEVCVRRFDSDWKRIFTYAATPVQDADGRPILALVTISDITSRKMAEEEIRRLNSDLERRVAERTADLQAINKELEAFSYSVSHDLRSPLRSLDGFSQALLEDSADRLDDEGRDNLQRIRKASQRMGHLIDDLLNLSRLTRVEMMRESVDLSKIAHEITDELVERDPQRQVNVVVADGLIASADPRLIRIAMENLLSNAWKFTGVESQGRIEFGVQTNGGTPVFFIRDNGVGFDMAYASKLFGAFQRLHAMHEFPGTGIGLTIVQRIVQRHGGRVWAESSLKAGATFYFTLSGGVAETKAA